MTRTPFLPAAAIFDMDGLMLDTERPAATAWARAARNLGWPVDERIAAKTIGMDEPSNRAIIMEELGADFPYDAVRKEMAAIVRREVEESRGIPQRPGLTALLDHLEALRVPLAVATSSGRKSALWKLRQGGILDRFSVLACGDEVPQGKPAPDVFLLAAERLGKDPADCVGFEDSPAGLRALAAAGIRSVFVKDLVEPPPEVLALVWRRCGDLAEAAALFG
ncbi:MAG: HAD family phosphatase [Spirochaetaceae bacterium]|jgi:beta-phosphoglucomutase-like phosphatase (HAD superfamily)|nr:HAD family phosphatase [Spirochaetaceae bacterium]